MTHTPQDLRREAQLSRWLQRDLEDQIREESEKLNNQNMVTDVKISQVIQLLNKGYTRYKKDPRNVVGSIEEELKLSANSVAKIFKDPKLRGKKVKKVTFRVIDDTAEVSPGQQLADAIVEDQQTMKREAEMDEIFS